MKQFSFFKTGVVIVLLFFTAGCAQSAPLKLDLYQGVEENEQVTVLKVVDERGKDPHFLGSNMMGYVIIPVWRVTIRSEAPVSKVMAQSFVQALEKRGIRARYRPQFTAQDLNKLPKDRIAVEIRIQEFEQKSGLQHLILFFGPAINWKSKVQLMAGLFKKPKPPLN